MGGSRAQVLTRRLQTPLGEMVAGATDAGVCLLEFAGQKMLQIQLARMEEQVGTSVPGEHFHTRALEAELREYFSGERREFAVPLVLSGTAFQKRVWRVLQDIPYGTTISYAELARRAGSERGVRAVGRAKRRQPYRDRGSVPPRHPGQRRPGRLQWGSVRQATTSGPGSGSASANAPLS